MQGIADQLVGALGGVGDPAADLSRMVGDAAHERHHRTRIVTRLLDHLRIVQRASVDARRGAGLEPVDGERTLAQPGGQRGRRRIAHATRGVLRLADMDLAGQEGAGREHHRRRIEAKAGIGDRATHGIALDDEIVDGGLEHSEVGLVLHHVADVAAIQRTIRLATRRPYGGALRCIQGAPLDAGGIRGLGHDPAERVDLLDQVALADAADRRVAAHRAHGLDVVAEQQRARAGARGRECGFGAGMAAADHDHVESVEGLAHGSFLPAPSVATLARLALAKSPGPRLVPRALVAARSCASQTPRIRPAWPPPITMTSKL